MLVEIKKNFVNSCAHENSGIVRAKSSRTGKEGLVRVGFVLADSADAARPVLRVAVYHHSMQVDWGVYLR
jgi:hypothetical protein